MSDGRIQLASQLNCTGCNACVSACPKGCIQMKEDKEGFLQPRINSKECVKCHKCESICPILNPEKLTDRETEAYASYVLNEGIRAMSSSGGLFFALAKWTIEHNGVVFGARFNDQWEVVHDYSETIEGVYPFMGSKYVQSRIGDTFRQAKSFLNSGRWVLFSGTPCQLGGLRAFWGAKYKRLLQVDIICYGTPSPGVWRTYLQERIKNRGEITRISFRDKRDGWKDFHFVVTYKKDNAEEIDGPFMKGFSYKVYLRESCYNCLFRDYHRNSDITIADYWGVDKHCNELFDNKGTSIVFCHSDLGSFVFASISNMINAKPQPKDSVLEYNPYMVKQHTRTNKRTRFFRLFRYTSSFNKSSFVIFKDDFLTRVIRKMNKYFSLNP